MKYIQAQQKASRGIELKRERLNALEKEQKSATNAKKELAEIAARKRQALALTQFLKVVLQNELQEKVDDLDTELREAKKRFAEASKAANPFARKKNTLQSMLDRLRKEKATSEKKRRLCLDKTKKCEAVLDNCLRTFDNHSGDIQSCKKKGLCCRCK